MTRRSMAHALSIIGEAGPNGFEYRSAVTALHGSYKSAKCRWTMASAPTFSPSQFRTHLAYAVKEGLVDAGQHNARVANGEYGLEAWLLALTLKGWEHVEKYDRPVLHRWASNVWENLPTVILSILSAILVAYFSKTWGLK